MKLTSMVFLLLSIVLLCGSCGVGLLKSISFDQEVSSHLKCAADAQTVEVAQSELGTAITNIEARGLTSGYTGILYNTQEDNLAFWYHNLKTSQAELASVGSYQDPLAKSNVLMRLRNTLLDHTSEGEQVTVPSNAPYYPDVFWYQGLPFLWVLMLLLSLNGIMVFDD